MTSTHFATILLIIRGRLRGKIKLKIVERMLLVEAKKAQELISGAKVKEKIVLICNK